MTTEIKKINPFSLAKIQAIIAFLLGIFSALYLAIVYAIILPANPAFASQAIPTSDLWVLVFIPFLYGLIGFVAGLIIAWIYNFLVKYIGGIKIELKEHHPEIRKEL